MKTKVDWPRKPTRFDAKTSRTRSIGASLLTDAAWSEIASSLVLSPRELEITRGVFDNLTEGAIAGNLRISQHTTHTHLRRLFAKLGVTTRTELVIRIAQELLALTLSETGSLPPICRYRVKGRCPMEG
jgi:DNA-binding CsgD family transcriptional regulator